MSRKIILTIGCELPGDDFEYVCFDSNRSLLDADIVFYETGFGKYFARDTWSGVSYFDKADSVKVAQCLDHWRTELAGAAKAGKLVVIFLAAPEIHWRETEYFPESISSYEALPFELTAISKTGTQVRLTSQADFLSKYWKEFGALSPYQAFVDGEFPTRLLTTKSGGKTVGAAYLDDQLVLLLPPLMLDGDEYIKLDEAGEESWTTDALNLGKRLATTVIGLHDSLGGGRQATPPPEWALDPVFILDQERILQTRLAEVAQEIAQLGKQQAELEASIAEEGSIRGLLYEQGRPLEQAVQDALSTLGFSVARYNRDGSEFDVLFESREGRCLGEVEGRDSKPIAISKFSQLERNLQEDYAREEVREFAKGVLFGNAARLTPPKERREAFTSKCITAAQRAGVALVRTMDLFEPVAYLRSNSDPNYAAECRQAIVSTAGDVVKFPPVPKQEVSC
jgi:hypothetical protein